ncbi:MAG: hypothetical protein QM578_00435 [Pantoea sp.]|uniref:hypothetical protein n=1 Tax=Pantoea sp. TaxID=69393 RepID=UPI0039E28A0E
MAPTGHPSFRIARHRPCLGIRSFSQRGTRYDSVMCALRQTLLVFGLLAALVAPAAQAQQRPTFGQTIGGAQFGARPQPFGQTTFPQARQQDDDDDRTPSMSDSVRRAQQLSGGRVIGTDKVQSNGRQINRVKIIDSEGRVRYIDDDRQLPQRDADPRRQSAQSFPQLP